MGLLKSMIRSGEIHRMDKKERNIYEAIKDQPDLVPVSKKLATRSIVFSSLSMLCVLAAIVLIYVCINNMITENFLTFIFVGIIGTMTCVILFIVFYVKAISSLKYQLMLNKCATAKLAISFVVLPSVIMIIGIIFVAINAAKNGAAA